MTGNYPLYFGVIFTCLLFSGSPLQGQYHFQFINEVENRYQSFSNGFDSLNVHPAIQPRVATASRVESSPGDTAGFLKRKLFHERLVAIRQEDYALSLDPVVNFQGGISTNQSNPNYVNTRGFLLEGKIGPKVSFYSVFQENQGRFPSYLQTYRQARRVIPGQGSTVRGFGNGGVDYSLPAGGIAFDVNKHFTVSLGQGRHFFGDGYRSLLLSDFSFTYPFAKIETTFGPVKYVNLWAQMYDTRREERAPGYDNVYGKKYLSAHYLSINLGKRWNLGLFESIVLGDTTQNRGLDPSFFNPVIFYRPIEFAVGSGVGNALLGATISYTPSPHSTFYGQGILDEFQIASLLDGQGNWVNKYALQLGYKTQRLAGVEKLFLRLEGNYSRPFTYSHRTVLTNYGHYGSPLAHPWESNFLEALVQCSYRFRQWEVEGRFIYGLRGLEAPGTNFGNDIYESYDDRSQDLGHRLSNSSRQGIFLTSLLRLAYRVNPQSGLQLEAGFRYRSFRPTVSRQGTEEQPFALGVNRWAFLGLRTALFNQYVDF